MSHSDGRNFFAFEGAGFSAHCMPAKSSADHSRGAPDPFIVALFRVGSRFASKTVMLQYLKLLEQFLQRKLRALRSNNRRRQAFHCSTCSGKTRPSNVPGACQFFLNMLIERDGSVNITESFLQHTACTTETNYAAKRYDLTVPDSMVEADAAYVASYGKCKSQYKALKCLIGRRGYQASQSTINRGLAKANATHCYEHEAYGKIVGFLDAFNACDEANFAEVELDYDGAFNRAYACSGAAKRMCEDGSLSRVFTLDFAHARASVRVRDVVDALNEGEEDNFDDEEDFDGTKMPPVLGRPTKTTMGLGRLVVCVGRTYAGHRVLLSIGLVSSETKANAEWFLGMTERQFGLASNGRIHFITDRSAAIRSAIATVYGDSATLTFCYVHFRRNVMHNVRGDKQVKAQVKGCLDSLFGAKSEATFEKLMLELKAISIAAYIYVCSVERSSWAPLFFDFNPLDNVTSNDAESVISSFKDEKNEGDLLGCFTGTLYKESLKLYQAIKKNEHVTGVFAYQVLQDAYEARMAEANQMLKVSQTDRDILVVAHGNYPGTTFLVNLSNLLNQRLWCNCLVSALEGIPCAHVLAAILKYGALNCALELVLFAGSLRRQDGKSRVSTLTVPPTSSILEDKNVLRPHWVDAILPGELIPTHAMERARPSGHISATPCFPRKLGARISSQGEAATMEAACEQAANNPMRQKFRLSLMTSTSNTVQALTPCASLVVKHNYDFPDVGLSADNLEFSSLTSSIVTKVQSRTVPTAQKRSAKSALDAGRKRSSRKCGSCGEPGHNARTCLTQYADTAPEADGRACKIAAGGVPIDQSVYHSAAGSSSDADSDDADMAEDLIFGNHATVLARSIASGDFGTKPICGPVGDVAFIAPTKSPVAGAEGSDSDDVDLAEEFRCEARATSTLAQNSAGTGTGTDYSEDVVCYQLGLAGYDKRPVKANGSCAIYANMPRVDYFDDIIRRAYNKNARTECRKYVAKNKAYYVDSVWIAINELRERRSLEPLQESAKGKDAAWAYWMESITRVDYWLGDLELTVLGVLGIIPLVAFWCRQRGEIMIKSVNLQGDTSIFPLTELSTWMPDGLPDVIPCYNDRDHYECAERRSTFELNDSAVDESAAAAEAGAVEIADAGSVVEIEESCEDTFNMTSAAFEVASCAAPADAFTAAAEADTAASAAASIAAATRAATVAVYDDFSCELKRPLTVSEDKLVENAFGYPMDSEAVVCSLPAGAGGSTIDILGNHMARIRGKESSWLHDEVVNIYMYLLQVRNKASCSEHPGWLLILFFNSYFFEKMFENEGKFSYNSVRRWSSADELFACGKIIIPYNFKSVHWLLFVANISERRIECYDSLPRLSIDRLCIANGLKSYLTEKARECYGDAFAQDVAQWVVLLTDESTPEQDNLVDCGVFTCYFANYIGAAEPFTFSQDDIPRFRRRLALDIIRNLVI